jgi:hypothetical protein
MNVRGTLHLVQMLRILFGETARVVQDRLPQRHDGRVRCTRAAREA